jgi:hypothetical protein
MQAFHSCFNGMISSKHFRKSALTYTDHTQCTNCEKGCFFFPAPPSLQRPKIQQDYLQQNVIYSCLRSLFYSPVPHTGETNMITT